jgi:hypothetical protein
MQTPPNSSYCQGISQTLLVTRISLSRFSKSFDYAATLNALTSDFGTDQDDGLDSGSYSSS